MMLQGLSRCRGDGEGTDADCHALPAHPNHQVCGKAEEIELPIEQ
jgi:hypothetical protein